MFVIAPQQSYHQVPVLNCHDSKQVSKQVTKNFSNLCPADCNPQTSPGPQNHGYPWSRHGWGASSRPRCYAVTTWFFSPWLTHSLQDAGSEVPSTFWRRRSSASVAWREEKILVKSSISVGCGGLWIGCQGSLCVYTAPCLQGLSTTCDIWVIWALYNDTDLKQILVLCMCYVHSEWLSEKPSWVLKCHAAWLMPDTDRIRSLQHCTVLMWMEGPTMPALHWSWIINGADSARAQLDGLSTIGSMR